MIIDLLDNAFLCSLAALLLLGAGEHGDERGGVNLAVVIDLHGVERVVHFLGGEFVAPGHQGMTEAAITNKT